jgi:AcrR family transcriptional regulator
VRVLMNISDVAQMGPAVPARERILTAAYRLFTRRGIRAVGNDEVIAVSGVAKATLYRHFPSKNDLVLAVLQRREELWTVGMVEQQSRLRGETTEEQLLAMFDVFHDWFQKREDFDGCSFINVLLELGAAHPAGQASIQYLDNIRTIVRERAEAAGLLDVDNFARSWHILMKGSIIAAAEGDLQAAQRAKAMGRSLIEQHRPPADG